MSKIYWTWKNIPGSLRRIWQNLTKGWNDSDLWSLDHTVAVYMLPRLKRFKEILHGHPNFYTDPANPTEEENFEDGMKKWKEIIDKMIYAFEGVAFRIDNLEIKDAGGILEFVKLDETTELGKKHIGCSTLEYIGTEEQKKLHAQYMQEYREEYDKENQKIKEGLELFSKYFQNLWD
jgi:hypothetical protein